MELLRLAKLLPGLSMVADIGMGLEPGEAGRAALVAMEIAEAIDADDPSDVYDTTLMQHVGCTGHAHEAARLLGRDEIAVKRAAVHANLHRPREVLLGYLPPSRPVGAADRARSLGRCRRDPGAVNAALSFR